MNLFLISTIVSFYSIKLSIIFLKKNLLDFPISRSSHKFPTPTGGGINFISTTIIIFLITFLIGEFRITNFLILFCIPLSIIGFLDDVIKLGPKIRYFFQLLTVILLLFFSSNLNNNLFILDEINLLFQILFIFFIILFFTSIINFINFMDGMDGLVGSCMLIIFISLGFYIDPYYFLVAGILTSYLFYNWYPANLFMGDSGSLFLSSVFVSSLFRSTNVIEFISLCLIATPLLSDAFFCVLRRFKNGEDLTKPHKLHLYQRLNQAGWSQSKVSLLYSSATLIISIIFFIGNFYLLILSSLITIILGFILDKYQAYPFQD